MHICWTEPQREVSRTEIGPRWCFGCRGRVTFTYVITEAIEMSYYGPIHEIRCSHCGLIDGDLFPGYEREQPE